MLLLISLVLSPNVSILQYAPGQVFVQVHAYSWTGAGGRKLTQCVNKADTTYVLELVFVVQKLPISNNI
jgi:hypothetical protein